MKLLIKSIIPLSSLELMGGGPPLVDFLGSTRELGIYEFKDMDPEEMESSDRQFQQCVQNPQW